MTEEEKMLDKAKSCIYGLDTGEKESHTLTHDLLMGGAGGLMAAVRNHPYHYREELEDGTVHFIFSKEPIEKFEGKE